MASRPFSEALRDYRLRAGLTQEALAERASLSTRAISDLERGLKHAPRLATLNLLCEALQLSPTERATFSLAARSPEPRAHAAARASNTVHESALIGRDPELQLIGRALDGGGPPILAIAGEPGIGKSRILHEAAAHPASSGMTILAAGCHRSGGQHPYSPLIEAIEDLVDARAGDGLAPLLAGCEWLCRLLPELADSFAEAHGLPSLPAEQERRLVYRAVRRLLTNCAGPRGTLLLLDDLQWAGSGAVDLLGSLARGTQGPAARIIASYRDTESTGPLEPLIAELCAEGRAIRHRLPNLDPAQARALLASLTSADQLDQRAALVERAGGVPFYVVSLARASHDPADASALPWDAEQSVRRRVEPLATTTRDLVATAAVIGRVVPHDLLAAVADLDEPALVAAIEETVQARLLVDDDTGSYRFSHDLIREVVEADLSAVRRRLLHRRVAEALAREHRENPDRAPVELLAYHFDRAGQHRRAVDNLMLAAERATSVYALREALALLNRALALAEIHPEAVPDHLQIELVRRRAEARIQTTDFAGAIADTQLVLQDARRRHDTAAESDALVTLGLIYRRMDAVGHARSALTQALPVARATGDQRRLADTLYHLGSVAWIEGSNLQCLAYQDEAVALVAALGLTDLVAIQAYHGYGEALFMLGRPSAAVLAFQRSLELARAAGQRDYESENLQMLAWCTNGYMGLGDSQAAAHTFRESLAIAETSGLDWHLLASYAGLATAELSMGNFESAALQLARARPIADQLQAARFQIMLLDIVGDLLRALGLLPTALVAHQRALQAARHSEAAFWLPATLANTAIDGLLLGDLTVGPALREALADVEQRGLRAHAGRCLAGLAELALAIDNPAECLTIASQLEQQPNPGEHPEWAARAQLYRGRAHALIGHRAEAITALQQALEWAEAAPHHGLTAESHHHLAQLQTGTAAQRHLQAANRLQAAVAAARPAVLQHLSPFNLATAR
ncbi:MAG: AAA family ATPase [Chloroflexota bacterium]